jgi:hypothetical protein
LVRGQERGRPERILLVAWFDPQGLTTISQNVRLLAHYSRFSYDLLNLFECSTPAGWQVPASVNLQRYNGIFIHCTISYNPDNLERLDEQLPTRLADYGGVKVMMKQDEHFRANRIVDFLGKRGFDLLLTLVEPRYFAAAYPAAKVPRLRLMHVLTACVSDEMQHLPYSQRDPRPVDIAYRGSLQPWHFGRLAYEKEAIGEVFKKVCAERGLTCDISSRWEDRLHGKGWFGFLGRCKAVLGMESGASIYDFDGEVEKAVNAFLKQHPHAPFEEVFQRILAPHEDNLYYRMLSPRHFEAAACRTVQILYQGRYGGILAPDRHYLSLRRDLANLDEVLARLREPAERLRLTETAHQEIIMNDQYHYSTFVRRLDDEIEQLLDTRR